jgi:hypothetical protein
VVEAVKSKEMSTGMFLAEASPVEVAGGTITLGLPEEFQFHKEMLERADKRRLVEEFFSQFLGAAPRVQFVTTRVEAASSVKAGKGSAPEAAAAKVPEIVRQAMDIFKNSKIVRSE